MAKSKLVSSPFTITESTSGVTNSTTATTASVWGELHEYQVPLGMAVLLNPTNYLFVSPYSSAATPAAISSGTIRVLKKNAAETEVIEMWQGPIGIFKDVGDEQQRPRFKTEVLLNAAEKLTVEIYSATAAKGSNGTFAIEGTAFYPPVRGLS